MRISKWLSFVLPIELDAVIYNCVWPPGGHSDRHRGIAEVRCLGREHISDLPLVASPVSQVNKRSHEVKNVAINYKIQVSRSTIYFCLSPSVSYDWFPAYRVQLLQQRQDGNSVKNIYVGCRALVAHTCNPSYSGGRDQEADYSLRPAWANEKTLHKKRLAEWLKVEALSSKPQYCTRARAHTHTHTRTCTYVWFLSI
jgi:hypothetical protein